MNNKARLYFNDIQSHRHGGALVDLAPQNKAPRPLNWNMKHYKSVEFLSNFRMSSNPAQTYSPLLKISGDGSDDIHKSMLGLIGLIIANQPSLQWKVTMQKRHLCRPPLLFSLAPQWPPHFFHSRIATESLLLLSRGSSVFGWLRTIHNRGCNTYVIQLKGNK